VRRNVTDENRQRRTQGRPKEKKETNNEDDGGVLHFRVVHFFIAQETLSHEFVGDRLVVALVGDDTSLWERAEGAEEKRG
jgi:hypothetical protein